MDYNEMKMIILINNNSSLRDIFESKYNGKYQFVELTDMSKENDITPDEDWVLRDIFETSVLDSPKLTKQYNDLKTIRRYCKNLIKAELKVQGGRASEEQYSLLILDE